MQEVAKAGDPVNFAIAVDAPVGEGHHHAAPLPPQPPQVQSIWARNPGLWARRLRALVKSNVLVTPDVEQSKRLVLEASEIGEWLQKEIGVPTLAFVEGLYLVSELPRLSVGWWNFIVEQLELLPPDIWLKQTTATNRHKMHTLNLLLVGKDESKMESAAAAQKQMQALQQRAKQMLRNIASWQIIVFGGGEQFQIRLQLTDTIKDVKQKILDSKRFPTIRSARDVVFKRISGMRHPVDTPVPLWKPRHTLLDLVEGHQNKQAARDLGFWCEVDAPTEYERLLAAHKLRYGWL